MLKGEKIVLDYISYSDLELILKWRNEQEIAQYFREYRILSFEQQKDWFLKINNEGNKSEYFFLIRTILENEPIGVCGLNYIQWINRTAQLSLYIGKDNLYIDNHGWSDEACQLLELFGCNNLNLNKIYCEVYDFDRKKIQLLNELDYKLEGRFEKHIYKNGSYYDSLFYGKLLRSK